MCFLKVSQAASQPVPYATSLNYDDVFKIQQVRNPFALSPVSFSALASYLECPGCALEQKRRRSPKEPKNIAVCAREHSLAGQVVTIRWGWLVYYGGDINFRIFFLSVF
jgi:hypothetical protein